MNYDKIIVEMPEVFCGCCGTDCLATKRALQSLLDRNRKLEDVAKAAKRLKAEYDEDWEKGRVSVDTLEANTAVGVALAKLSAEGTDE